MVKQCFGDIYSAYSPLETDLQFDNSIRSLASQHLVYLGDLCKFKGRIQKKDRQQPKDQI